jgi:hypothetical protein
MKRVVIALVVLLIALHQDFWWWDDIEPLVFGFLPIGLAYHAFLSLAAAAVWALAVKYCWPANVEVLEDERTAGATRHREL